MSLGYDMAYAVGLLLSSPLWGWKLARTGKWRTDWPARFGRCAPLSRDPANPRRTLLIHAVSVGEVDAIRKLVDHLASHTDWRLVICVTTDTGLARARTLYGQQHTVVRYPLDLGPCVRRFLDAVRPDLVALVELEVWPNFVGECRRRGVPVCVINGRLSPRSFKRYKLIAPLLRPTFARLAAAAVQTPDYAQRFAALGTPADRVHVLDSMKWDGAELAATIPGADELAAALGIDRNRPLIVAGSTAEGEEKLLLETCPREAQLMLVPRKPERFAEVADLMRQHGPIVRRTEHRAPGTPGSPGSTGSPRAPDGTRLFLLDTIGELRKAYALCDVAIVGRSFLGLFGSNPLESIALGKATVIGPCYGDFQDMVDALRAADGIVVTDQPGPAAATLLADRNAAAALAQRGRNAILSRLGAVQRHADLLGKLMPASAPSPSQGEGGVRVESTTGASQRPVATDQTGRSQS
jgi:3-deoxy-D-manno-octulosonic-acid transferase